MRWANKFLLCILIILFGFGCASPKEVQGRGEPNFGGGYSDAFFGRTHNRDSSSYTTGYVSGYITVLPVNLTGMVIMPVLGVAGVVIVSPLVDVYPHFMYFMVESILWGVEGACYCVNGYHSLHWVDEFRANKGNSQKRNAASRFVDGFVDWYASSVDGGVRYYDRSSDTIYQDAYGLGVHSDQYGRPVRYEVQGWPKNEPTEFLKVKPDVYGPGIGQDQFGRPVRAVPRY